MVPPAAARRDQWEGSAPSRRFSRGGGAAAGGRSLPGTRSGRRDRAGSYGCGSAPAPRAPDGRADASSSFRWSQPPLDQVFVQVDVGPHSPVPLYVYEGYISYTSLIHNRFSDFSGLETAQPQPQHRPQDDHRVGTDRHQRLGPTVVERGMVERERDQDAGNAGAETDQLADTAGLALGRENQERQPWHREHQVVLPGEGPGQEHGGEEEAEAEVGRFARRLLGAGLGSTDRVERERERDNREGVGQHAAANRQRRVDRHAGGLEKEAGHQGVQALVGRTGGREEMKRLAAVGERRPHVDQPRPPQPAREDHQRRGGGGGEGRGACRERPPRSPRRQVQQEDRGARLDQDRQGERRSRGALPVVSQGEPGRAEEEEHEQIRLTVHHRVDDGKPGEQAGAQQPSEHRQRGRVAATPQQGQQEADAGESEQRVRRRHQLRRSRPGGELQRVQRQETRGRVEEREDVAADFAAVSEHRVVVVRRVGVGEGELGRHEVEAPGVRTRTPEKRNLAAELPAARSDGNEAIRRLSRPPARGWPDR